MARIVAGRFRTMAMAHRAVAELQRWNCSESDISVFFNAAPGQQGAAGLGGDEHADPEATGAAGNTAKGAAIGAGLGLLAGSLAGPLAAAAGAAVGGYTGSLLGTLRGMGNEGKQQRRWPAGVIVAVNASRGAPEQIVLRILKRSGATPVQVVDGEWRQGEWRDFDPVSSPATPQIVYRIIPGGPGKWSVFEGDLGKLLSEFADRQQAVDYASALARTKKLAVVEVYRAGGVLESSRVHSHPDERSTQPG